MGKRRKTVTTEFTEGTETERPLFQAVEDVEIGRDARIGVHVALEIDRKVRRRIIDEAGWIHRVECLEWRAFSGREIDGENTRRNFGAANNDVLVVDPLNRLIAIDNARDWRRISGRDVVNDRMAIGIKRGDQRAV